MQLQLPIDCSASPSRHMSQRNPCNDVLCMSVQAHHNSAWLSAALHNRDSSEQDHINISERNSIRIEIGTAEKARMNESTSTKMQLISSVFLLIYSFRFTIS